MSIFHLSLKSVGRSSGRSSTAAAAYRAGARIVDERTGVIHDYEKKGGVESARVLMPGGGTFARAELWNAVELHHKRGDATPARECVVALPAELPTAARRDLAEQLGQVIADTYGVAVDVCVHAPSAKGDDRNYHAHILMTACSARLSPAGELELGKKVETLDPIHCQRRKLDNLADVLRPAWESMVNEALATAGSAERVDHRSLVAQGINRVPSVHLGHVVQEIQRRGGQSDVLDRIVAEGEAHALLAASLDAEMAGLQTALQEALQAQEQAQAEVLAALAAQAAQVAAERARLEPRPEPVPPVAVPPAERLVQVETELQRLRADLREREVRQSGVGVVVNTRAEVKKARAQAPALRRRFDEVARVVKDLAKERSELPWWRLVRAWQIRQQLPLAVAERSALAAQVKAVQAVASVPDAATVEARRGAMEGLRRQLTQLEGEAEGIKRQAREGALQVEREQLVQRVLQAHGQGPQEQPQARERPR